MFGDEGEVVWNSTEDVLNAPELFTLKRLICYVNFAWKRKKKKKQVREETEHVRSQARDKAACGPSP